MGYNKTGDNDKRDIFYLKKKFQDTSLDYRRLYKVAMRKTQI